MNDCAICGKTVNIEEGGCAVMMAVCVEHNTNLINNAFCKECYENLIYRHLRGYGLATGQYIAGITDREEDGK